MRFQAEKSPSRQAPKPRGRRKKVRTEPVRPICPQCEKQFSNQSALTKHKLTHSDERKFACQQCSKAFKRHDHLTGHMQTHSNRKPFNCTIQGCDKTYCDARSLRRHKENIHQSHQASFSADYATTTSQHFPFDVVNHITQPSIDQQVSSDTNTTTNMSHSADSVVSENTSLMMTLDPHNHQQQHELTNLTPGHHQHQHQDQQQQQQQQPLQTISTDYITPQDNSLVSLQSVPYNGPPSEQHQGYQQPVHLPPSSSTVLCRRMQRLHSDGSVYTEQHPDRLDVMRRPIGEPNQHHNQHHHYQASFSAGYATTTSQHFSFNHMTQQTVDQQISSNNSMPHSADSVVAENATLIMSHDQHQLHQQQAQHQYQHQHHQQHQQLVSLTPGHHQQQSLQTISTDYITSQDNSLVSLQSVPYNGPPSEQHQGYQQPVHLPPSSSTVLCRRMQRLHSDGSAYAEQHPDRLDVMCRPIGELNQQHQQHQQHYQQTSFSADYATTTSQHFPFDFNHMTLQTMDQQISSNTNTTTNMPHSADSVTDSGLGLNLQYEY